MEMNRPNRNVPLFNAANPCYSTAMAYVPWQEWHHTFDLDEALKKGTLFHSLYKPYGGGSK